MSDKDKKPSKKSTKKILIISSVVLILILGVATLGKLFAVKIKERITSFFISRLLSKKTDGKVNVEDGGKKVTYSGKEGDFSFNEGGNLPTNFPTDMPIYPNSKVANSWEAKTESGRGVSAAWETSDAPSQVADFYKGALEKAGWKISSNLSQEDSVAFSFQKEGKNGLIGITKADNVTTISITVELE